MQDNSTPSSPEVDDMPIDWEPNTPAIYANIYYRQAQLILQ